MCCIDKIKMDFEKCLSMVGKIVCHLSSDENRKIGLMER